MTEQQQQELVRIINSYMVKDRMAWAIVFMEAEELEKHVGVLTNVQNHEGVEHVLHLGLARLDNAAADYEPMNIPKHNDN